MNKSLLFSIFLIVFLAACSSPDATENPALRAPAEPTAAAQAAVEPTAEVQVAAEPVAKVEAPAAPTAEVQAPVEPTTVPPEIAAAVAEVQIKADAPRAADLFSVEMLANMAYSSTVTSGGQAPLSSGRYREPQARGSTADTVVTLTEYVSFGELDGQPLAAVVLVSDTAEGGPFYSLHIVGLEEGAPLEVASTLLENSVQVDSLFITNGQVIVELLALAVEDALCCPTDLVVQIYQLRGDELLQAANEVVGSLSGAPDAALFERIWTGRERFDPQEESGSMAGNAGQYFLILHEDGTYQHAATCGASTGTFTTGGPNTIRFWPESGTVADCAPAADGKAVTDPLAAVVAYHYVNDLFSLIGGDGSAVFTFNDGTMAAPTEGEAANDVEIGLHEEVQSEAVEAVLAEAGGETDEGEGAVGEQEGGEFAGASAPGSILDLVQRGVDMVVEGAATTWEWRVRPDRPQPQEAGAEIHPSHIMITFDNENLQDVLAENGRRLLIYPVQPYLDYDEAAGRSAVGEQTGRLMELIDSAQEREGLPQGGMPLLPPTNSLVEGWREFRDLDFVDGSGVRYIGKMSLPQESGTEVDSTDTYTYQGLTADGRYYVSLWWPLDTAGSATDLALLDEMVGTVGIGE